jgi:hypothetical protein
MLAARHYYRMNDLHLAIHAHVRAPTQFGAILDRSREQQARLYFIDCNNPQTDAIAPRVDRTTKTNPAGTIVRSRIV